MTEFLEEVSHLVTGIVAHVLGETGHVVLAAEVKSRLKGLRPKRARKWALTAEEKSVVWHYVTELVAQSLEECRMPVGDIRRRVKREERKATVRVKGRWSQEFLDRAFGDGEDD